MGALRGRAKPEGSGRKKGVKNGKPRTDSVAARLSVNPIHNAYLIGVDYGIRTSGTVGEPYIPREFAKNYNLLLHIAYMNGVRDGRRKGSKTKVKVKEKVNGSNKPVRSVNGGNRNVRHPVPAVEIGQRTHPAIRPSGIDDSATGGGKRE